MSSFDQVSVKKEANIYFDGKVTSRTVTFPDGSVRTLGIMLPGEFEFGTDKAEIMDIQSGNLMVKLPGSDSWQTVRGGQSFNVPAKSKFQLQVSEITDYICTFVD